MAIGDPWDTSYDPREYGIDQYDWMLKGHQTVGSYGLRNHWTHYEAWGPDHSHLVPQKDPSSLDDRRGGRFCTEGCGCVKTEAIHPYHPNVSTILPHELSVRVFKDRNKTRYGLAQKYHTGSSYDAKNQIALKYSNGAWRGRVPCKPLGWQSNDDSCRHTTDYYHETSDCHFATSRFKNEDPNNNNDSLDPKYFNEYEGSVSEDGMWSFVRRGGSHTPEDIYRSESDSVTHRYIENNYIKDVPNEGMKEKLTGADSEVIDHQYSLADDESKSVFYRKYLPGRLVIAEDGYVGTSEENGEKNDGSKSTKTLTYTQSEDDLACIADGFTPLIKRPYCRNPITGKRTEQECEYLSAGLDQQTCTAFGTCDAVEGQKITEEACLAAEGKWTAYKWLYGDEASCIATGICEKPEDIINTDKERSDNFIEARCEDSSGNVLAAPRNKAECEEADGTWVFGDQETCEARHGTRDAYCSDSSLTTEEECKEAEETWNKNRFISNDWMDSEYDKRSCCGEHMVDQNHPFRTPQFSGTKTSADGVFVKDSNLENTTCFTPYEEYVLMPPDIPAVNQYDRHPLAFEQVQTANTFWTLLIRPCRFWDSCFENGEFQGDNKDGGSCKEAEDDSDGNPVYDKTVKNKKDCEDVEGRTWVSNANEFGTGCGEEVVLKIPTNQLLNDSNFNLTLSDQYTPKGRDLISGNTKRDTSKPSRISYWREVQPSWDLKYGLFDKAYEWWNVSGSNDPNVLNPPSMLSGPFPADSMHRVTYHWWCMNPDANFDGIADGSSMAKRKSQDDHCDGFTYLHADGGNYTNAMNPKGAETYAKFNLQPQPFKATEERQLRAKTIQQAKSDYAFWYECVSRKSALNSAGHWFANYGQDYFLYFDYETGLKGNDEYEAHCESVSTEFNSWVKSHIGHLDAGTCSQMGAIGWINQATNDIDKFHPCGFERYDPDADNAGPDGIAYGCAAFGESSCPTAGYCLNEDGTFERGNDESSCTGEWRPCCKYFKKCTGPDGQEGARVVLGYKPETTEYLYGNEATTKEACERAIDSAMNGGEPGAGGTWEEGCANVNEEKDCKKAGGIPEELADIVFGEQHGTCEKEGEDPTSTSKETCENEGGEFTADSVGGYTKRIGKYIKPTENIGKVDEDEFNDAAAVSGIKDGIQESSVVENAIKAEKGNSPDYWQDTGLYPVHEQQISYISDSCVGTRGSGRIQFASNENPIKITSPSHNLKDGDKVDIRGVLGNFPANVMTNKEWAETQWEGKKANMKFKGDEKISHPFAVCPCGSDGSLDTDKYYACYGQVVSGIDPEPAPFFVVKNATPDTFDLYTCDKRPIDGTITYGSGENCEEVIDPTIRWYSVYGHMDNITLKDGDLVEFGKQLGTISDAGTDEGWNHLHFSMGEMSEEDQTGNFAFGALKGVSFDTGFTLESCFDDYTEERERTLNKVLDAEKQAIILESTSLIDLLSTISAAEAPLRYIRAKYSTTNTHDNYFGIDIQTHESETCDAGTLVSESKSGFSVYNPVKDSSPDGEQIVTYVAKILPEKGAVILAHEIIISATENEQSLDAYRSCPFTGKWETWLEPTTEEMTGESGSTSVLEYRPGWSGTAKKWSYRANDFYVSIEQKGVCPVCNDHFMPEHLNATISTVSSEYLNVFGCSINPCYEPNICVNNLYDFDILFAARDHLCVEKSTDEVVDRSQETCTSPDYEWKIDPAKAKATCKEDEQLNEDGTCVANCWVGEDWWNYSTADGYCCADEWHKCEGSTYKVEGVDENGNPNGSFAIGTFTLEQSIEDCLESPEKYGNCKDKYGKTYPDHTPQGCADVKGQFTPLTSRTQCEKFLRRRINVNGVSNCRRCSDTFTNENGVPIKDKVDSRSGYYDSYGDWRSNQHYQEGLIFSKDGKNCCTDPTHADDHGKDDDYEPKFNCECIDNPEKYPTCAEFVAKFGECNSDVAGATFTLGELTGTCFETVDENACSGFESEWTWEPDMGGMGEGGDGGEWTGGACSEPDCADGDPPTFTPDDPTEQATAYTYCKGGKSTFAWEFDPCGCYPEGTQVSKRCLCDKIYASDMYGRLSCKSQKERGATDGDGVVRAKKDSQDYYWDNSDVATCCGAIGSVSDSQNNGSCYDIFNANQPIESTCPGLQIKGENGTGSLIDIPMDYDGEVWRSEWTLMNSVGTHQCKTGGSPRNSSIFTYTNQDCKPEIEYIVKDGAREGKTYYATTSDTMPYINADCDGCDMAQLTIGGVGNKEGSVYRDVKMPSTDGGVQDGHFIRLILGCGNAVSSIDNGVLQNGGLGPSPSTYQNDSIKIFAEITNCSFVDGIDHETLKKQHMPDAVKGQPPCFPNLASAECREWEHFGKLPSENNLLAEGAAGKLSGDDRKYMFAGKCVSKRSCNPKGPCANTECCTYEGRDIDGLGDDKDSLWSGSIACSTGGHIQNICQAFGVEMGADKRAEVLTVHDIIDVNHITGAGTLVAKSLGGTCSYSAGTKVTIGMAGPAEAESSSKDDYTRNKHSANPFLRGTVLSETIKTPKTMEYDEEGNEVGYNKANRRGKFILVKVNDITPLINRNSRKDRHLKYNDIRFVPTIRGIESEDEEPGFSNGDENPNRLDKDAKLTGVEDKNNPIATEDWRNIGIDDGSGSSMVANKSLQYPYGMNPYPVATQTISGTSKSQMWPKGKDMSPDNLESLRLAGSDRTNDIVAPGRTGRLWRDGGRDFEPVHSIVHSDFFAKKKDTAIQSFTNFYSPHVGECVDNKNHKTKTSCNDDGHIWVPQFLNTVIETTDVVPSHDEKIIISGTIAYKATCKGSRMGYCDKADGSGKNKNIKECADASQFDDEKAGKWVEVFEDAEADKYICEEVFNGKWVIGTRNPDTEGDPDNDNPLDLQRRERDFETGCPPSCQLKGYYTDKACTPFQDTNDIGGECYECINETIQDSEGNAKDFIQCPLSSIDGSHVLVSKSLDTYVDNIILSGPKYKSSSGSDSYSDVAVEKEKYVSSYGDKLLTNFGLAKSSTNYFALAAEEHITTNNEAKIWSQEKVYSRPFDPTRLFDPTHSPYDEKLSKEDCESSPDGYYWHRVVYNSSDQIHIGDTIGASSPEGSSEEAEGGTHLPICLNLNRFETHLARGWKSNESSEEDSQYDVNENQLQLDQLLTGATIFSTQKYYGFLGDRFSYEGLDGSVSDTGLSGPAGVYAYTQLSEACELSSVCHFERVGLECRGGRDVSYCSVPENNTKEECENTEDGIWYEADKGYCKTFTVDEEGAYTVEVEEVTKEECPSVSNVVVNEELGTFTGTTTIFTHKIYDSVNLSGSQGLLERHQQEECLEEGHEVIPVFLCYKLDEEGLQTASEGNISSYGEFLETGKSGQGKGQTILTPQECEAAGGKVFYDGIFNTASRKREDILKSVRTMETYLLGYHPSYYADASSKYKSRDFMVHDINHPGVYDDILNENEFGKMEYDPSKYIGGPAVTSPKKKWKGLIYANDIPEHMSQKDKETYSKYVTPDPPSEADPTTGMVAEESYTNIYNGGKSYWSRHGGAFDITISQKLPNNGSRNANSDQIVNLEYWIGFPQICCNLRGPANYWGCEGDCFPTANGDGNIPRLEHLQELYGIDGTSLIHVNITEKQRTTIGGGGSTAKRQTLRKYMD